MGKAFPPLKRDDGELLFLTVSASIDVEFQLNFWSKEGIILLVLKRFQRNGCGEDKVSGGIGGTAMVVGAANSSTDHALELDGQVQNCPLNRGKRKSHP